MCDEKKEKDGVYIHVLMQPEPCDHIWPEEGDMTYARCELCGISFMRYAFTEAP